MCLKEKIDQEKSYEEKLRLVRPALLSYVKSRVFNSADADDIVQDTLSILYQKQKEYKPNKSLYSWGMSICGYQIMAYLQKLKRSKEQTGIDDEYAPDSLGYFFKRLPFQDIVDSERKKVFDQISNLLTSREKIIIELSLSGLSANNIICKLKITRNAFGTSKSRAIKKIRAYFKGKDSSLYKI